MVTRKQGTATRAATAGLLLILGVIICSVALILDSSRPADGSGSAPLPALFLWAWERPEDLGFLEDGSVGVAFLAGTLYLEGEKVRLQPRRQTLRLHVGTPVVTVVRIEVGSGAPPSLSLEQAEKAAAAVLDLSRRPASLSGLQIDFDATRSQRPFYKQLLTLLRRDLPSGKHLSMTALASWCLGDPWIADLPVDEAVPMLFEMGPDGAQAHRILNQGGDFRLPLCRTSLGLSTLESVPRLPGERRVYVFNPDGWSRESALESVRQWRFK